MKDIRLVNVTIITTAEGSEYFVPTVLVQENTAEPAQWRSLRLSFCEFHLAIEYAEKVVERYYQIFGQVAYAI